MYVISQSEVKFLRSLSIKRYRKLEKKFVIEGYRLIEEALSSNCLFHQIWMSKKFHDSYHGKKILPQINRQKISYKITRSVSIQSVGGTRHNQGIVALLSLPDIYTEPKIKNPSLFLDNIADPGNLGTLFRTAEWFGIKNVYLNNKTVDPFNPKVIRSGMGAHFHLNFYMMNDINTLFKNFRKKKFHIIGADLKGQPVNSISKIKNHRWVLILGSEAHGLSEDIAYYLTQRVFIPKIGNIESLNVTVSGGIILSKLTEDR